uniref:Nodule Cysteine-Rich (NCR) secreted peptide n=1 Tax=Caenorhabditis tropicalis TaxID=1561998 RepID=A0A1I7UFJ8_9PELO
MKFLLIFLFLTISTVSSVSSEECSPRPCLYSLPKCSPSIPCPSPSDFCDNGRCISSNDFSNGPSSNYQFPPRKHFKSECSSSSDCSLFEICIHSICVGIRT